jgi:hypothetical protein
MPDHAENGSLETFGHQIEISLPMRMKRHLGSNDQAGSEGLAVLERFALFRQFRDVVPGKRMVEMTKNRLKVRH